MLSDLVFRLRALFRRRTVDRELDDELAFHLDRQIDKHLRAGHPRDEAVRLARLDLGGVEATKEECREARGVGPIDALVQDVRYGLRVLGKSPGFTAVAVLTLTLGIGANTALFSVVNGVLLHPLRYPQPGELVRLHAKKPSFETGSISYPNFVDWQRMNRTFSAIAVSRGYSFTLTGAGDAEKLQGQLVSADFFSLLGVLPLAGRTFVEGEDLAGAAPVALVGAGLWRRKLGASPEVVGKTLVLDGRAYTIVGVIAPTFDLPIEGFAQTDVYVPIGQWDNRALANRAAGLGLHGIGRLKPGVTLAQARADMDIVTRSLAASYPEVDKDVGAAIVPLEEAVVARIRSSLLLLLGAVGFVLLIACANVANLLLARSAVRARELAIRLALGATRGRALRQLLTESVMLSVAGGALGVVLAAWGTHALVQALPPTLPRADAIGIDVRVLAFTTVVSIVAGILFGLAPAIKATRPNLADTLRQGGRGTSGARHRLQGVLVVLEVAMALVLLVGAGLMLRTLSRLWDVDPGFQPRRVTAFGLALSPAMRMASPEAIRALLGEVDAAVAGAPGVEAASLSWASLPMYAEDDTMFWVDGRPRPPSVHEMTPTLTYIVGPDYLRTMGIPLLAGRFFTPHDDERARDVVVVDDVFARSQFAGDTVVGKRIHLDGSDEAAEIVGVVGHVKQWGLDKDDTSSVRAQAYRPFRQLADGAMPLVATGMDVVVRSRGGTARLVEELRGRIQRLSSDGVIYEVHAMEGIISDTLAARRFSMAVLAAFAALALLLASIGIYGVIAYVVSQRTNEIGIRMALGAGRGHVLRLVLTQGARLALAGVAIGVVLALALTRLMGDLLYGVPATDPPTFAAVAAGLILVALTACYLPARRALRVDPVLALRHE